MEKFIKVYGLSLKSADDIKADEDGLTYGFFTSDDMDETGDIITRDATERALANYRIWRNIRFMHKPEPVGVADKIGVAEGLDWNEVGIRIVDDKVKKLVEEGALRGLSVGIMFGWDDFDIGEDGVWVINDYQLIEISLVDHPANYAASLKDMDMSEEKFHSILRSSGGLNELIKDIEPLDKEKFMSAKKELEQEVVEETVDEVEIVEEEVVEEEATEEETAEAVDKSADTEETLNKTVDETIEVVETEETESVEEEVEEVETEEEAPAEAEEEIESELSAETEEEKSVEVSLSDVFNGQKDITSGISELTKTIADFIKTLSAKSVEDEGAVEEVDEDVEAVEEAVDEQPANVEPEVEVSVEREDNVDDSTLEEEAEKLANEDAEVEKDSTPSLREALTLKLKARVRK